MGDGKKGPAPCGHEGEAVIGQYYQCSTCDKSDWFAEVPTVEVLFCEHCGSFDIDEEFQLDPMAFWFNPHLPVVDTRCNSCGRVWAR